MCESVFFKSFSDVSIGHRLRLSLCSAFLMHPSICHFFLIILLKCRLLSWALQITLPSYTPISSFVILSILTFYAALSFAK